MKRHPLSVAIIITSLALAACNSNDEDRAVLPSKATTVATTTVTVTPSLGKILNGRVALKNAKTGAVLAPTQVLTPAENGTATFTVPVSQLAEPILAEVLPTTAGILEYADEALEKVAKITVPVADASKPLLRAAASVTPNANIGVTALTESAVQQAEKADGGLIAQNINQANAAVKNQLKLDFDVTQAPIVIGVGEFAKLVNQSLDQNGRAYAAYLAALAKEAKQINPANTQPAFDIAKAFADDFSDGTFNGKKGDMSLSTYDAAFATAWADVAAKLVTALNALPANTTNFDTFFDAVVPTTTPTTATPIRTENGIEDNPNASCGQMPELTVQAISDYVGNYDVVIKQNDPITFENTTVKNTVLKLAGDGTVTLDGVNAKGLKYCSNFNSVTNQTGVVIQLDKNDALGRAHVDFWPDGKVNGTDYTNVNTFRFIDGIKQGLNTPPATATCTGNTNPFGCLTITGANAPAAMVEHVGSPFLFNGGPQVQMNGSSSGAVTWFGSGAKANGTNAGVVMGFQRVVGSTQHASYTFQQYDANLGLISNLSFKCKDANNDCAGLSIDLTQKTVTFNNVVMKQVLPSNTNAELTFNGVLKY